MGIVKTLHDLLAQMCKYSFGLIRMEPCYFWVPFKPSHLLPGVDPGVSFDFLHGQVQCPFSAGVIASFFITYRVQGIQMTEGISPASLFQ